jgi:hypothetical protein
MGVMHLAGMLDGETRKDEVERVVKVQGPRKEIEELALIDGQRASSKTKKVF